MKSSKRWIVFFSVILFIVSCCSFIYFTLFPYQKPLPITNNIPSNSQKNMEIVFQENFETVEKFNWQIEIDNNKLYATNDEAWSEIYIFDISSPEEPVLLNKYIKDKSSINSLLEARGGYLFLDTYEGLEILNVSDINNLKTVFEFDKGITAFEISGNYLYATGDKNNLYILDIAIPESAYLIKEIKDFDNFINPVSKSNLEIEGDLLFFMDGGLNIYDISDPLSPNLLVSYKKAKGPIDSITILNNIVWTTGWDYNIFYDPQSYNSVLDISNPYKPKVITAYNKSPAGTYGNLFVFFERHSKKGEHLSYNFHVFNATNPNKLIELGYISGNQIGGTNNLEVIEINNQLYLYTINWNDELTVIKFTQEK